MSEKEYAGAFKSYAEKYFAISTEINAKPLPRRDGLNRKQQLEALSRFVRDNGRPYTKLADEVRMHKPPPSHQRLHREWLKLLDGQVARDEKYAAALDSLDTDAARRINKELLTFLSSQIRSVTDELVQAAGNSPELKKHFDELLKDANL